MKTQTLSEKELKAVSESSRSRTRGNSGLYAEILSAIKGGAHILDLTEDVKSGTCKLTSIPGYIYKLRVDGYDVLEQGPYETHVGLKKDGKTEIKRKIGMRIFYNGKKIPVEKRPVPGSRGPRAKPEPKPKE